MNNLTRISQDTGIGSSFIGIFNNNCAAIEEGVRLAENGASAALNRTTAMRDLVTSLNTAVEELKMKYDTLVGKYGELLEKYDNLSSKYDDLKRRSGSTVEDNPSKGVSLSKGAPKTEEEPVYELEEDHVDDRMGSGENEEPSDDENDITE